MHQAKLIVAADAADRPRAEAAVRGILAMIEAAPRPDGSEVFDTAPGLRALSGVEGVSIESIAEGQVTPEGPSVLWLWADMNQGGWWQALAEAQDHSWPVLLTPLGEGDLESLAQENVTLVWPDEPAEVVWGVLRGLLSHAGSAQQLATELNVANRQQSGLCEQIARLDEELRLAAKFQSEFLPGKLPRIGDVRFHTLWRPASYVSGDMYGIERLDENHVGFFVADAVGHGVSAALMSIQIKRGLPTKVIDGNEPKGYRLVRPADALAALNREIITHQTGKVRFATACYALLNIESMSLAVARAGHPFPLLLRGDGATETIEPEGGLLGVFEGEDYEESYVQLSRGDRLLIYSDGFEVAFPREKLANDEYTRQFESLRTGELHDALRKLENRLDHEAGSLNQRDDLTVVGLEVLRKSASGANAA